jgi:hypothetical protein
MAETAARARPAARGRDDGGAATGLAPVRVTYYRRMKCQKIYPVTVTWEGARRAPDRDVKLRLVGAGAQILPAERPLDSSDPEDKATFFVTPLARGWMRSFHLEILVAGRKVQEVPLAAKVVSHRWTWFFFVMMFLAPWFLLYHVKYAETVTPFEVNQFMTDNVPDTPGFVKDNVPAVHNFLVDARQHFGVLGELQELCRREPIAFYAGAMFALLWLLSLWCHRDKRKKAYGQPIAVPRDEEDAAPRRKKVLTADDFSG